MFQEHEGRKVPVEEVKLAVEAAFLQIRQYPASLNSLAVGHQVIYRAPDGVMHTGPLVIKSLEARTALIEGFLNDRQEPIQLRVMLTELAPADAIHGIVHSILSESYPCPHCSGKDPSGPAGQEPSRHRTDN